MLRLVERAPTSLMIGGREYPVDTDYVSCLLTVLALQDAELLAEERVELLLDNLYDCVPHDPLEAVRQGLWFLRCGRDGDNRDVKKLCDFAQDGDYIYNALLKKGVDLDKCEKMHWWTFVAHFSEIPESAFTRIVYLRERRNRGKLTKDERAECARIGWNVIDLNPANDEVAGLFASAAEGGE